MIKNKYSPSLDRMPRLMILCHRGIVATLVMLLL